MEDKFKKISELLGSKVTIEESPKTSKKRDEDFFTGLLEQLCQVEAVYAVLQAVGITASNENPFYTSIRILMEQHYGITKTEIILWWVFESITEDGGILPLIDESGKTHIIKTPTQLYKFIKKYE
jgi:hypothetical protein